MNNSTELEIDLNHSFSILKEEMNDEDRQNIKLSYDFEAAFEADKFSPKSYPDTEMLKRSFKDLIR